MPTKTCTKCNKEKSLENFYNTNENKDKKFNVCKNVVAFVLKNDT